ncbi:MAG: hypothetical protein ACK5OH_01160, partial [bacterium]
PKVAAKLFVVLDVWPATCGLEVVLLGKVAHTKMFGRSVFFVPSRKKSMGKSTAIALCHNHYDGHIDGELIQPAGEFPNGDRRFVPAIDRGVEGIFVASFPAVCSDID